MKKHSGINKLGINHLRSDNKYFNIVVKKKKSIM